jgi:hypothetical protein
MNEAEEPSRGSKRGCLGPLIVLAVLVVVGGIAALGIMASEPKSTAGSIQYGGGSHGPWKIDVDYCYTRRDIVPVGGDDGAFTSYASRLFTTKETERHGLYVIRDVRATFGDNTVTISQGPKESPTREDLTELAKFERKMWSVQLSVPGVATPIRITPEMCKRFALDVTSEISRLRPKDHDGSVELDCTTPDGARLIASVKYNGCP